MNENKNGPLLSNQQVDELLQNFKSDIKRYTTAKEITQTNSAPEKHEENLTPSKTNEPLSTLQITNKVSSYDSQPDQQGKILEKEIVKTAGSENQVSNNPTKTEPAAQKQTTPAATEKSIVKVILGTTGKIAGILLFTIASVWLLSSGDKMSLTSVTESAKDRTSVFNSSSANLLSASLDEIHHMPKVYILEQNDDPAPVPNQNNFTKIEDPVYKNYDGTPIDYYKDETIEVKCWKEMIDGAVFNFADVQIAHPSQFKRKLVDNVISKKHLDYPLSIFKNMNGVVGMTSDYCAYRGYGSIVQYGNIVRDEPYNNLDLLIYDKDGNLSYIADKNFRKSEYYNSEDVIFTFAFGPMLVNDYTVNTSKKMKEYPTGEVSSHYPRAAIGQFGYDKHYLLCTVDYTSTKIRGTTVTRLAEVMQEKGCRFAYNMDGGQTGALMFNNELFNVVAYGGQREVSDIMYFATAIPNE